MEYPVERFRTYGGPLGNLFAPQKMQNWGISWLIFNWFFDFSKQFVVNFLTLVLINTKITCLVHQYSFAWFSILFFLTVSILPLKIVEGIIRGRVLLEVLDTFFWNFKGAGIIKGGTLLEVLRYLFFSQNECWQSFCKYFSKVFTLKARRCIYPIYCTTQGFFHT